MPFHRFFFLIFLLYLSEIKKTSAIFADVLLLCQRERDTVLQGGSHFDESETAGKRQKHLGLLGRIYNKASVRRLPETIYFPRLSSLTL